MNKTVKPRRLMRISDVMDLTGMSRSTIYAKMKEGQFPRPLKISYRHVAWDEDDVHNWIRELPEAQFETWVRKYIQK